MEMQTDSYSELTNRYDDAITARRWWAKLYMHALWGIDYCRIASEVMQLLPSNPTGALLEVPIGTAVFTAPYYQEHPLWRITGVDYSDQMLRIAKARIRAIGAGNVALLRADVSSLPFADASFGCVLTMNGVQSFPDKRQALREMARVLRPGGTLCGSFYVRGVRRVADRIALGPLQRKKIFFKPHWTPCEAKEEIETYVGPIAHFALRGPIAIFSSAKR